MLIPQELQLSRCFYLFRGYGDTSNTDKTLKQFPRFFIY